MFKYKLNQLVKVKVLDTITTGTIHRRIMQETMAVDPEDDPNIQKRYWVYVESIKDYVEPWEDSLDSVNEED